MKIINNLLTDKIKSMLSEEIKKIAEELKLSNVEVELDSVKQFTIYLPHQIGKDVSLGFDPVFINVLKKEGFDVHMEFSSKTRGMTLCGLVTKKIG